MNLDTYLSEFDSVGVTKRTISGGKEKDEIPIQRNA